MRAAHALTLLLFCAPAARAQAIAPVPDCLPTSGDKCRRSTAWIGDSITFGFYTTANRPPAVLGASRLGLMVDNLGVNGETVQQMQTRWLTSIRSARYGTLVFLGGVNNLSFTGDTPATVWAVIKSILDQALADGMRVYPCTILPFKNGTGWTTSRQTDLQTINASILAWCATNNQTCVDTYTAMGDLGDPQLLRWPGVDNIHPSDVGSQALAAAVSAAIATP
jgi:lysophospholipase L1-like esterase